MSICDPGVSPRPRAGFPEIVVATASVLEVTLLKVLATRWQAAASAGLAATTYDLTQLCNTDPPPDPGLTDTDIFALFLRGDPVATVNAQLKIDQLLKRGLWYSFCECTSGTQPTPPSPVDPTGTPPAINPPSVFPVITAPACVDFTYTSSVAGAGTLNRGGPGIPFGLVPTAVHYHIVGTPALTGPAGAFTWAFEQVDPSNTTLRTDTYTVPTPNTIFDVTVPYAVGANSIRLTQTYVSGGYDQYITGSTVSVYCGVAPGAPVQPCCPPDAALQTEIDEILSLVTLIQRQIAPFAYVPGTVHAGLTGHGSFAISGLLGLKIEVTAVPAWATSRGDSPTTYFDLGWVTLGTPDGYDQSTRIDRLQQITLPPRCSAFTDVGYQLGVGVEISITELVREP